MLDAALEYAGRGWRVFPCAVRGKTPMPGLKWQAEATTDAAKVRAWWGKWPEANIGLVTGWPEGPGVVLDIDDRSLLEEIPERLTCERYSYTGRNGWHLFFALPPRVSIGNTIGNLPKGKADVRGCGSGYVLAPPSVHPNGEPYRWCKEAETPSVMPKWLLDVITGDREWGRTSAHSCTTGYAFDASTVDTTPHQPTSALERAQRWLAKAAPAVQGSGGQTTLFTVASHMAGLGLSLQDAQDLLWSEYNPRCVPPWKGGKGERQFRRHVREGYLKGPIGYGDKLNDDPGADLPSLSPGVVATPTAIAAPGPSPSIWAEPEPLGSESALPRFPLDALPEWVSEWAYALAESTQTPPELAGMLALVSASAAIAKKAVVRIKRGWLEPLNLWAVIAMAPSSRKSPVFAAATRPLVEYEQQQLEGKAIETAMARHKKDAAEARLKRLKDKLAKCGDPTEQRDWLDQIEDQQREVDSIVVPTAERLLAQDATTESLIGLMANNGGKIAVLSDEGGVLGIAAGRYSGAVNVDALLQGYSGGDIRVDRRGRESEYVKGAALTLGLTVQVEVLREVFGNSAMRGRGLLARPLYVIPRSNVGLRRSALDTPEVPEALTAAYRAGLVRLCGLQPVDPVELHLTDGARSLLAQWDSRLEAELRPDGKWATISEWAGKLVGGIARLAGVLHVSEYGLQEPIAEETMWRAIQLGNFCLEHAHHAFDSMKDDSDVTEKKARELLEWLQQRGESPIKRRTISQARKRHFDTSAELDACLDLLVECGWLRAGKVGQAVAYEVNPQVGTVGTGGDGGVPTSSPYSHAGEGRVGTVGTLS